MKLSRLLPLIVCAALGATTVQAQEQAPAATPEAASGEQEIPSAEFIVSNMETISPLNLVYAVDQYWNRGDKLKAAFWFYIWQIRSLPWIETEPALLERHTQLDQAMGPVINSWLASDPAVLKDTVMRAVSYEPKLPLLNERPDGISETYWNEAITRTRTGYAAEATELFSPEFLAEIETSRKENGLPVGPHSDAGAPLPDEWR